MIVEGEGQLGEALTPTEHWLAQSREQVMPQTLERSLPHRSLTERERIAEGYLGVTTWQTVCLEFGLC